MTETELRRLIANGQGASEIPSFIAAGGDVNCREPPLGMPLLHLACEHQNLAAIRALAAAGADLDVLDSAGQAALHIAVDIDVDSVIQASGSELDFATTLLLLSLGANPRIQDNAGRTPRDWAANYGYNARVEFDRRTAGFF